MRTPWPDAETGRLLPAVPLFGTEDAVLGRACDGNEDAGPDCFGTVAETCDAGVCIVGAFADVRDIEDEETGNCVAGACDAVFPDVVSVAGFLLVGKAAIGREFGPGTLCNGVWRIWGLSSSAIVAEG